MNRQPPESARASTASSLSSAASVTVSAAVAARSDTQSVTHLAGTKLSFVSPPTSKPKLPNWKTRSCICNRQSECKEIMRGWEKLGADYANMLDYAYIPPISKKTNDLGKHKNGYRKTCFLHLFGRGVNSKEFKDGLDARDDRLPVAIHHFKPCLREALVRCKAERNQSERFRCSKEEGIEAGLTNSDLCPTKSKLQDPTYYLVPTCNFDEIKNELSQAQTRHGIKQYALAASTSSQKRKIPDGEFGALIPRKLSQGTASASSSSTVNKRSPAEREYHIRVNDVQTNPHKAILDFDRLKEEFDKMAVTLHKERLARDQLEKDYKDKLETMKLEFEKDVSMSGLTRRSILSSNWHAKYDYMSNHLFGFEKWDHFKCFVQCAFGVSVDVDGKGPIKPFEMICMCAMVARRAYRRPSLAGIYCRTPTSITAYLQKWMPVFGRVGQNLSELPMEKTHNFITEATAKEWKTLYIYPDGTVVDFADTNDA